MDAAQLPKAALDRFRAAYVALVQEARSLRARLSHTGVDRTLDGTLLANLDRAYVEVIDSAQIICAAATTGASPQRDQPSAFRTLETDPCMPVPSA